MSKELNEIQKKLNKAISKLSSKLAISTAEDRRKFLVPVINSLEEALNELKEIGCLYELMKLGGCREEHPEELGGEMSKKEIPLQKERIEFLEAITLRMLDVMRQSKHILSYNADIDYEYIINEYERIRAESNATAQGGEA